MPRVHFLDTLRVENFDEIALSRTVKEIEAILCFAIFGKNSKIQNGRHFWGGANFLKIAKTTMLRYPVGENFDEIALSRTVDRSKLVFCHFWQKFENSKWPPFLVRGIYEAIPPKSNPIQAINPINLHTKFQKARLNSIP